MWRPSGALSTMPSGALVNAKPNRCSASLRARAWEMMPAAELQHGDVVVAPDAFALHQVESDEADEMALVGQRDGQHRADALRLE